ncbi:hypothetical protein NQZ68_032165 [Dissostichus eleginoides]|nr:hypothetical protein NQZ68_032165 [Dissostichus eleginoides]
MAFLTEPLAGTAVVGTSSGPLAEHGSVSVGTAGRGSRREMYGGMLPHLSSVPTVEPCLPRSQSQSQQQHDETRLSSAYGEDARGKEGREAAICHGLCPVLCLVSLLAAELWIMTPVGGWAPLPGRSRCLKLLLEICNFNSKEQWSRSPGGGGEFEIMPAKPHEENQSHHLREEVAHFTPQAFI